MTAHREASALVTAIRTGDAAAVQKLLVENPGLASSRLGGNEVARGARVDALWHAAALGMTTRLEELLNERASLEPAALSQAFWHACAGGQRRAAEYLLIRGADLNWVPNYAKGTPLDAARGVGTRRQALITWLREQGARSAEQPE